VSLTRHKTTEICYHTDGQICKINPHERCKSKRIFILVVETVEFTSIKIIIVSSVYDIGNNFISSIKVAVPASPRTNKYWRNCFVTIYVNVLLNSHFYLLFTQIGQLIL
jgi:hypothetical protein